VRFVHGDGRVGAAVVASKPDLVFLTGSTATGRKIAQATAVNMTPFLNELGGKDPMIVLEDADMKAAAKWGVWGAFYNTGQTCMAVERVYVVQEVYDEFVSAVIDETNKYKVGYSPDIANDNHIGPLTFQRQADIIEDHLQDALAKGAKIVAGGQRQGMYMEPTVVVDVDHSMKLMQEETFGPVIPIMKVEDEVHATQLANHSEYGLSACVWSRDLKRAQRIADKLEVGSVNINDAIAHYPVSLLPFGGVKMSGNARTHGKGEVIQFTHSRSYAVGQAPLPFDVSTVMRAPNHYKLGSAILHFAFGVTPKQRLQPLKDLTGDKEVAATAGKFVAAAGATAALATIVIGLFRARKS
jgi:acyl-CoA reductase-like NAD-dependent aldehyde dehydrogenase